MSTACVISTCESLVNPLTTNGSSNLILGRCCTSSAAATLRSAPVSSAWSTPRPLTTPDTKYFAPRLRKAAAIRGSVEESSKSIGASSSKDAGGKEAIEGERAGVASSLDAATSGDGAGGGRGTDGGGKVVSSPTFKFSSIGGENDAAKAGGAAPSKA